MNHSAEHCVIIPDVHQDVAWVERILAQETSADLYVFLGDYFDSHLPRKRRTGVAATCAFLADLQRQLAERVVFLLGNHDVQYLEARGDCLRHRVPRFLHYRCGSAFKAAAAAKIAKHLPLEFWRAAQLFVRVNGWLLSHAGLVSQHWPPADSVDLTCDNLERRCREALRLPVSQPHPLLEAGKVRGGNATVGGITWLDWDDEFDDSVPLPQIVGHTGSVIGARQKGRSWCLDGQQTCYGILRGNTLEVASA